VSPETEAKVLALLERVAVALESKPAVVQHAAPTVSTGPVGAVFPNYGKAKGQPIRGASRGDLEYYAEGCRRALNDPDKARFHDRERQMLAAIEAELARVSGVSSSDSVPF
jgi:hypothetical protein